MTWTIWFLSNDRAEICLSSHRTTDKQVFEMIVAHGKSLGHLVRHSVES